MAKTKAIEFYKKELAKMFSEADFKRYFDMEGKILTYEDLEKYNSIEELLPDEKDFKIILTETKPNSGHWCGLARKNNNIMWFDSYGLAPDAELKYIPKFMNRLLHQNVPQIHRLLKTCKKAGFTNEFNHYKFQAEGEHICTCGRWTIFFILMTNLNYSMVEQMEFIERWKFELDKPNDILVVDFIL